MPPWQPRATVQLSQLSRPRDIGAEVDFNGALVWAGDVNTGVCMEEWLRQGDCQVLIALKSLVGSSRQSILNVLGCVVFLPLACMCLQMVVTGPSGSS